MSRPRRTFGATWWGHEWREALETRARLDPNRLPRGRTYARQDRVGPLVVEPGSIRALVQGSRPAPYRVRVGVRTFTDDQWDRVLDAIAERAGHAAALLDGELPPAVLTDIEGAGVELLPGAGDLEPDCTCPDWADPCKHAAAVCYLMADVLDRDPFELFHLRGRSRDELLMAIRNRRQRSASPDRVDAHAERLGASTTVPARVAFSRPQAEAAELWAFPLPPLAASGHPPPLTLAPPPASGLDAAVLHTLASDAAARGAELLRGDGDGGMTLPREHDLARRAAQLLGTSAFGELADGAGMPARALVPLALAWRHGGREGIEVATEEWTPGAETDDEPDEAASAAPAELLDEARTALRIARPDQPVDVRANRVTSGEMQLRLARSGRWYRFARAASHWELADGPADDPAALVD